MVSKIEVTDRLWHLLWSQTACDILTELSAGSGWELVSVGFGWGLRRAGERQCELLLYPSVAGRPGGDLSLLVRGQGVQVIPRYGHSFPQYVAAVEDVVATVAAAGGLTRC